MADSKITALTSISTSTDPANDPLVIVDVSDTSMAATGTTKKVTLNQLLGASGTATLASATITGDLTVDTSTLKVDSANNFVGVATASPVTTFTVSGEASLRVNDLLYWNAYYNSGFKARAAGYASNVSGNTAGDFVIANTASSAAGAGSSITFFDRYRISNSGVHTWEYVGGVAGTAMTLNSTGLGVGGAPISGFRLNVNNGDFRVSDNQNEDGVELGWSAGAGSGFVQVYNRTTSAFKDLVLNNAATITATGNVGIGVTPKPWRSGARALQVGANGYVSLHEQSNGNANLCFAAYEGSANVFNYTTTGDLPSRYVLVSGTHQWYTAPSGTAGNAITFTEVMRLDASGNLILLPSNTPPSLGTNGQLTVNATSNTNLRFSYRGSDGVTRVANLTLA